MVAPLVLPLIEAGIAAEIGTEVGIAEVGVVEGGALRELDFELPGKTPITVKLSSSAIRSATYIEQTETLILNMTDGSVVEYYSISSQTFEGLVSAPSAGAYYNKYIRLS